MIWQERWRHRIEKLTVWPEAGESWIQILTLGLTAYVFTVVVENFISLSYLQFSLL